MKFRFGGGCAGGASAVLVVGECPDGASVQLAYKTLDGQKIGYFYFPFAEGHPAQHGRLRRHRYPGEIGMVLPQAGLDALGPACRASYAGALARGRAARALRG